MPLDVREGAKSIELQLEQPIGMVKRVRHSQEGHRAELHISACQMQGENSIRAVLLGVAFGVLFLRHMKQNTSNDDVSLQRDPDEWKTGDEPMTAAQRSYLETLARDSGEEFNEELTKAEASKRIEGLRQKSPRAETARRVR